MMQGLLLISVVTLGVAIWFYLWPIGKGHDKHRRQGAVPARELGQNPPFSKTEPLQPSGDYSRLVRVRSAVDHGTGYARRSVKPPTEIKVLPSRLDPVNQAKQLARANPKAAAALIQRWLHNNE